MRTFSPAFIEQYGATGMNLIAFLTRQRRKTDMSALVPTGKRAVTLALVFGVLAALLPFIIALPSEKAVAAHIIGLVIAAIAAKAFQWPGRGDGLLLASAGALAIVIPVFAWQMPAGGAWTLLLLGAMTLAIGLRHALRNGETQAPADTSH